MNSYTSIEQSKKLMALGLNPDTASFYWHRWFDGEHETDPYVVADKLQGSLLGGTLPCWTLSDLLAMLPYVIGQHALRLVKSASGWLVEYRYMHGVPLVLHYEQGDDLVDLCAAMATWLLENKYQLKK